MARIEAVSQWSEHDPEKWEPVFLATNAERVCAEIMLKQKMRP